MRDVNGTLWYVRNGEILRVGNLSQGWARVIIDLAVPVRRRHRRGRGARCSRPPIELRAGPEVAHAASSRSPRSGASSRSRREAIVVRLVVKTRSGSKDDVARELRMRLKKALDELGVRLPALNSITLSGLEGALSVRGARPPKTAQVAVQDAAEKAAAAKPSARAPRAPRAPKDSP